MLRLAEQIIAAPLGKTHLFSVGQAGFILKSAAGHLLAIDLYLSDCVERMDDGQGYHRLLPRMLEPTELIFDAVICTHPHLDHFDIDAVPDMITNKRTKLFCSVDCRKLVEKDRLDYYEKQITYVAPGDTAKVEDFEIDFVDCDHGEGAPDAVGVIVTVDGKKVYEAGDTCLRLDRVISLPRDLDVLIGPINGAFGNMNEEELPALAEVLHPGVTIPCHYGMFAAHHGDVGKFFDIMTAKKLPCLLLRQGEGIVL